MNNELRKKEKNKINWKRFILPTIITVLVAVPFFSFAAPDPFNNNPSTPQNFKQIICSVAFMALNFVPLVMLFAFISFLQGLIKYVRHGDNEEMRTEGNKMMIYGIIGLFFMVSVWGILKIFVGSYSLPFGIPQFKTSTGTDSCGANSGV